MCQHPRYDQVVEAPVPLVTPNKTSFGLTMLSMEITAPLNTVRINTMSAAVRAKPRAALSICEQRTTSHANLRGLIKDRTTVVFVYVLDRISAEGPPISFYQMFSKMKSKFSCFIMVPQTHPPSFQTILRGTSCAKYKAFVFILYLSCGFLP